MKTFTLPVFMIWAVAQTGEAQGFQYRLITPPGNFIIREVVVNEAGEAMSLFRKPPNIEYETDILPIENGGKPGKVRRLYFPEPLIWGYDARAEFLGTRLVFAYEDAQNSYIFNFDEGKNNYWCRRVENAQDGNTALKCFHRGANKETLVVTGFDYTGWKPVNNVFHLVLMDEFGGSIWQKGLKIGFPASDKWFSEAANLGWSSLDGSFFMKGTVFGVPYGKDTLDFLVKISPKGEPLIWKAFKHHHFEKIEVRDDGIFLLGHTAQPVATPGNRNNAIIAKLDFDLKPVWARAYSGEAFEYSSSTFHFFPDGSILLAYSTFGQFPVILARLGPDGQILGQKGYPFFEPQLDIVSDGSLIMATNYVLDQTGAKKLQPLIVRTGTDGELRGCETYATCLESQPMAVEFDTFTLTTFVDPTYLVPIPLTIDSFDLGFEDYCSDVPLPSPDFWLPDSVCLGDSVRTTLTNNLLATAREWRIAGPGVDSVFSDSLHIGFRFTAPGNYIVSQKTWSLGCGYEAQRKVVVLPPPLIEIYPDSTICHPPIELKVAAERPVLGYFWGNGATSPTIPANFGEKYFVTITDGRCWANDSFLLEKFAPSAGHCFSAVAFPNVFSPNGDGLNDGFGPLGADFEAIKLAVFDRWGNRWFESTDGAPIWKPVRAQPGVFTFRFDYRDVFSKEKKVVTGSVTVVK